MGQPDQSAQAAREAYRNHWPLGPAKMGASGTFIMKDGKLVPATCMARLRKNDARNIVSLAAGVQSYQVKQAERDVAEAGLSGVRYNDDGDVIFKTRQTKLKFLRHAKMHDNDEMRG